MIVLVTGGAGFIGSNFVRYLLKKSTKVIVLDLMTYAGNLENLSDFIIYDSILIPNNQTILSKIRINEYRELIFDEKLINLHPNKMISNISKRISVEDIDSSIETALIDSNIVFVYGNILDTHLIDKILPQCDNVVNFAAETHVDRSILNTEDFIKTNIYGTYSLLESVKKCDCLEKFIHISTDEIYGVAKDKSFKESDSINPQNPYSASKAASDRLVNAYYQTYGLPVNIVRPSNNYGPYQYPEKLIPVMIINAINDEILPVYGDGKQVRDWLFVQDTVKAIELIMNNADDGEVYNIAGRNERQNIDIVSYILDYLDKSRDLIKHVKDRPGHDIRYSIDDSKIRSELGFTQSNTFEDNLDFTIQWYVDNKSWWSKTINEDVEYKEFIKEWYSPRI